MQMDKLFFAFESCDYRVHLFLTKSLANVVEGNGCTICVGNAAVQLAFCYAIGFGVDHGIDKNTEYLNRGSVKAQVDEGIDRVNNEDKKEDIIIAQLARLGYRHDFAFLYARDGVLTEAIKYYRRAVAKRRAIFEPGHFSILRLLGLLLSLMRHADQFEEAMEVAAEMERYADRTVSVDQVEIKAQIVRLYASMGEYHKAEALAREVSAIHEKIPSEAKSTERLDNLREWARALVQVGKFDDAIPIAKDSLEECLNELSDLHATTIATRRCLAQAYAGSGELQLSRDMNRALVRAEERLESEIKIDPSFVEDIAVLGVQCYRTGETQDAKHCYDKIHRLIQKRPVIAKHAVIAVNNYATGLILQGDIDTALLILEPLLVEVTNVMGSVCQEAALVMANLAYLYSQRASHQQAEDLERQVLQIRRRILGDSHANTITAFGALRLTLIAQERYDEAAELAKQEINAAASVNDTSLSDTVRAAETIAITFYSAGAFSHALPFFEYEQHASGCDATEISLTSMSSMACAALCYLHLENVHKARSTTFALLSRACETTIRNLEVFLVHVTSLAKLFLEKDCFPETEQVLALALSLWQRDQQDPSLPEGIGMDLRSTADRYLERRNLDIFDVRYNPSVLLS